MRLIVPAILAAALFIIACGDGGGINDLGLVKNCKPESDAPARAAGDTFITKGGVSVVVVTEAPEANPAQADDEIAAHFKGFLADGTQFGDSREQLESAFEFGINTDDVICGWVEGVVGMSPGEVRELTIPPALAYGNGGFGDIIAGDATVVFEVEMIEFVEPEPAE